MNQITDTKIDMPKSVKADTMACDCGDKQALIAYTDRNAEVVIECSTCLSFLKFPKGTK